VSVKMTLLGCLIYASMAVHGVAFGTLLAKRRRVGMACFIAGFALAAAGVLVRWVQVGHVPLQNLFEVFLVLSALPLPLALLSRRRLKVGGEAADALVAVAVLFPAGFVFAERARPLMPALQSPLFGPHVATYVTAYAIMAKAAVQAVARLLGRPPEPDLVDRDEAVDRMVRLGFPFLTVGLILGATWGKLAWGHWWNWDPKEMWSLATWLTFALYFHLRAALRNRESPLPAATVLTGSLFIVITLLWANLSRLFAGLHSYA
jgi:ABC-type transport system involved in cytochrome c biogenesis permease subunit